MNHVDLRKAALGIASRDRLSLAVEGGSLGANLANIIARSSPADGNFLLIGTSTPKLLSALWTICSAQKCALNHHDPDRSGPEIAFAPDGIRQLEAALPWCLRTARTQADSLLQNENIKSYSMLMEVLERINRAGQEKPLVQSESMDVVVVDMMINRLDHSKFELLLQEAFRVLKREGILHIVAMVADEPLEETEDLRFGTWQARQLPLEKNAAEIVAHVGFHGITYHLAQDRPVRTVHGVEIRAVVLEAYKGKQGTCYDQGHAVIYRGPWSEVADDDGHRYQRGARTAVCGKTYKLLTRQPYRDSFIGIEPYVTIPLEQAPVFDCNTPSLRDPAVSKGRVSVFDQDAAQKQSATNSSCCGEEGCC
ncbi:hypothetical protein [Rhizobium leguminosarum]|uniref:Methyltransferase domain-containing protein n=1 Tax=Rhizobium leguminosarum TaxID=384 RepID=A0A7K3VPD6_RHILE|nr:hypothetical protein [Rhizobium leguminosarum]NEK18983.1 hypothetical protein [Rhizobium leguminosarum]